MHGADPPCGDVAVCARWRSALTCQTLWRPQHWACGSSEGRAVDADGAGLSPSAVTRVGFAWLLSKILIQHTWFERLTSGNKL